MRAVVCAAQSRFQIEDEMGLGATLNIFQGLWGDRNTANFDEVN